MASNSNGGTARRGRKPIHDEVRRKLVDTGLEIMLEEGYRASLNDVSFADIVDRSGVARATAYRALSGDDNDSPSEWLERELLKAALRRTPGGNEFEGTAIAAMKVFEENAHRLEGGGEREFTDLLRAMIRVGAEANFDAVVNSLFWRAYMATAGSLATRGPEADPEMLHELRESESKMVGDFAGLYETLAATFGRRIKPEYTWRQFATMLSSLVEGLVMRVHYSDHVGTVTRATGPDGEDEKWNLLGIGTEALVNTMTEPLPDQTSADLMLPDA